MSKVKETAYYTLLEDDLNGNLLLEYYDEDIDDENPQSIQYLGNVRAANMDLGCTLIEIPSSFN